MNCEFDAKFRTCPFHNAKKIVGIEPAKCVTLDMPKIESYYQRNDKRNGGIIFKVDYKHYGTKGIWVTTVFDLLELAKNNPHRLQNFNDYHKNQSIQRLYISTDEMQQL